MEINLGNDWYISKDNYNWILSKKQEIKEGKSKGGYRLATAGYYNSIEQLIRAAIEKDVADPQIRTLVDLKQHLDRICNDIKQTILNLPHAVNK